MEIICFHWSCKFNWNLIFNGMTSVATLGAFLFAIVIAKRISFKRDLRRKQLDTVFELVTLLQNLKFHFSYNIQKPVINNIQSGSVGDICFDFFEMTVDKYETLHDFIDAKFTVFVSEEFLFHNPILKYVHNPFLPKPIVLKLINLYPRGGSDFPYDIKDNQLYISVDRLYETHRYRKEVSRYYLNIDKLFESTEGLDKSIRKWLRKNGISDLNFRDRPINLQNYP